MTAPVYDPDAWAAIRDQLGDDPRPDWMKHP